MKLIHDLPEIFDDFGDKRRQAFLDVKEYKDKGIPVVGMYCAYFPIELAMAIGAIPVGLCAFSNEVIPVAEQDMPKSMCPLVKSSYGFAKSDKCPFFHFADLVIGETTCDGKKKMYEMMSEFKPVFVMELPNSQSERSREFWRNEIIRTKEYFEDFFNVVITDQMIRDAVHLGNEIRTSLKRLCEVMKLDPAPVLGENIQNMITGSKYRFDFKTTPEVVDAVTDKILEEYAAGKMLERRPRILVTGCPIGGDSMKIIRKIEENGGVVVAVENCSGVKTLDRMIDEDTEDIYGAIANRYISTGCSIMTPNDNRIELIGRIVDEYHVDGVVEMILTGCHSTGAESAYIRKFVNEEKNLPYISIDTDYSTADVGQISTRLSAFLEMIQTGKLGEAVLDMKHCYKIILSGITQGERIERILKQIWDETEVPIYIDDHEKGRRVGIGLNAFEISGVKADLIKTSLQQVDGEVVALCYEEKNRTKITELVEILAKSYAMSRDVTTEIKTIKKQLEPDFMWILSNRKVIEKSILSQLLNDKKVSDGKYTVHLNEEGGILVAGIGGKADRDYLIGRCREYMDEYDGYLLVGNGFHDVDATRDNKAVQNRILEFVLQKGDRKKVHLTEEYYHELAVEYISNRIDDALRPEELVIIENADSDNGNLYDTLYWYLRMKRNVSQTAAKLKIHRNTILPRIAKINELIHLDEKDGAECERLLISMEIDQYKRKAKQ